MTRPKSKPALTKSYPEWKAAALAGKGMVPCSCGRKYYDPAVHQSCGLCRREAEYEKGREKADAVYREIASFIRNHYHGNHPKTLAIQSMMKEQPGIAPVCSQLPPGSFAIYFGKFARREGWQRYGGSDHGGTVYRITDGWRVSAIAAQEAVQG